MKLYIAEKPSLAIAIAAALPKPQKKQKGYIEVANGDVVSWCIGHILEQAEPEAYDEKYKKWQLADLPIIPESWQLVAKTRTRSQLTVLRKLVKSADHIIHAGDPDREGQLLVDEVIDFLKVSKTKKQKTERLLINDLNVSAVKKALQQLKPNSEFIPLSVSALARSRADWLYGINLTRAYTIQGQKSGYNSVLSVGRVQTPILGLVAQRDVAIENFSPHDYFQVHAHICTPGNEAFVAKWQPSKACDPHMDDEGRIINKALAENVVNRINDQPAEVTELKQQEKKQAAALPYNLSSLQIDAAKIYSMNAKLVLDVCQALYEKHKLITYPRSDCRYLPNDHHKEASSITAMLSKSSQPYGEYAKNADCSIKSKAWNSKKISAHHAIIPTLKSAENLTLNPFEKNIYALVVRQYLAQFYPLYVYHQVDVELTIANGKFTVNAKTPKQWGWKVLFNKKGSSRPSNNSNEPTKINAENMDTQTLPVLKKGDLLHCKQGELLSKLTQAPAAFTDASLLSAMTNIARFVKDPNIKKILKETDGLGTEATRAGIIDLLFKRGFLIRVGKNINATDIGKALVNALPVSATSPDMTAQWEAQLNNISEKQASYQSFMSPLVHTIGSMISGVDQIKFMNLPKVAFKPKRKQRYKKKAA